MAFIAGWVAAGIVALQGFAPRHRIMLGCIPPYLVTTLRQSSVYVLYFGIVGLGSWALGMNLDFSTLIFFYILIARWWNMMIFNASFITAHKVSSY